MTRYLLDTGPLTGLLFGRSGASGLIRPWMVNGIVASSALAYGEVFEHVFGKPDSTALIASMRDLAREIRPHGVTRAEAERYARLRRQLRPPYGPGLIGDIDTLIAATAFEHNLIVVTTDNHFLRVPDLPVMLLERKTFAHLETRSA